LGHGTHPDWLLTLDCDVEVPTGFVDGWATAIAAVDADATIGALNGGEEQRHLFSGLPNAQAASSAFGRAANAAEAVVGIVNLNGVNHAVRTAGYLTAGPYVQPTVPGPGGTTNLAGSDWDLGVRIRLAGYEIGESPVTVRDRGRRLMADLFAYLSGTAYEGEFARVHATGEPVDIDGALVPALADAAIDRALFHFFFKIVLADPSQLDRDLGLAPDTVVAMRTWIERWPWPGFADSRNGFVYGRLPRFTAAFVADVRHQFGLDATAG
ncbi:MAG TPA: hypothetical protein PLV68_10555, partial [Ilumatobacteraceae bacterium]|nr:hypothetical protein [Ilumatobacteraceae bacterium]